MQMLQPKEHPHSPWFHCMGYASAMDVESIYNRRLLRKARFFMRDNIQRNQQENQYKVYAKY